MDDSHKAAFTEAMRAMCMTFGVEAQRPLLLGYWMALHDLTLEQFQRAAWSAMRDGRSFPKPVELREKITGSCEELAELAWTDVLSAVPLGPYRHVTFADRFVNAAIRQLGGWPSFLLRFKSAEEEKWARKDFQRAYVNLRNANVDGELCAPLVGLSEKQYIAGRGLVDPQPQLIESKVEQHDGTANRRDSRPAIIDRTNEPSFLRPM